MAEDPILVYHADSVRSFGSYKKLAERAFEQIADDQFFARIDPGSNSLAVIVKHVAGNLHSRWRDFLSADGEKTDRDRDAEFEISDDDRDGLMKFWESGWQTLFENLEPLTLQDLSRTITIRGEPYTVVEAINRQLTHYSYHVGQIVFLAKHLRSGGWQTLSVPKNRSAEFNRFLADKQAAGEERTDRFDAAIEFSDGDTKPHHS